MSRARVDYRRALGSAQPLPPRDTAADRDRAVAHLLGRGWVPHGDLLAWLQQELGLTRDQGAAEIRTLLLTDRLEQRVEPGAGLVRHWEYRVRRG